MKPIIVLLMLLTTFTFASAEDKKINDAEYATVHLYRNAATAGLAWNYKISVNGKKIKIKNGSHYQLKVKPGETVFRIHESGKFTMTVNLEAGKEYYIKSYIRLAMFPIVGIPELAEVKPEFAANQLNHKIKEKNRKQLVL